MGQKTHKEIKKYENLKQVEESMQYIVVHLCSSSVEHLQLLKFFKVFFLNILLQYIILFRLLNESKVERGSTSKKYRLENFPEKWKNSAKT